MANYKVQIRMPYFTNTPSDCATNTLYFTTPVANTVVQDQANINSKLTTFYQSFDQYFSPVVGNTATWKGYNLEDAEPRQPVLNGSFGLTVGATGTGMPEEVACVLSFQSAQISGVPAARRRGRIFIGPLSVLALAQGTSSAFVSWSAAFKTALSGAAVQLAVPDTVAAQWVQHSGVTGLVFAVKNGWIDNQPDTQRRRGHQQPGRTLWTAP